jgi:cobalt-precorrin 5A hydrolase/precorrin-3B C17-methyltransferase
MALTPVIFILGPSARGLGLRLAHHLPAELREPGDIKSELRRAFADQRPIVGLCATGILIRILAPCLSEKRNEPPVIAVAEDGSVAIPLLGGHHGANDLARRIADVTGGACATTTASELRFGVNLEEPEGYRLANPEHLKDFVAGLLAGESVRVNGEAPWLDELPQAADARLSLLVTEYAVPGGKGALVYHPRNLALGVGCERGASSTELQDNVNEALAAEGLAPASLACVVSIDLKADEPAVSALARHFDLPLRFFSSAELQSESRRIENPSEIVFRETGAWGVAEAAALLAAGPQSELIVPKTVRGRTTCAIARAPRPIIVKELGRSRGSLCIVGIGPGAREWRSPAAETALRRADDWVGYGLYLDLVQDLRAGQREHRFPLGEEETRALHALNLAGEGRDVTLICSGDAGIYAMAALVFELLDTKSDAALTAGARRIAVEVTPGISAFQAAAARSGAVLGHDFCAISLSDLLTPWITIERRLHAAAQGDFVVALYNPRSANRTDHLDRAIAILRAARPSDTPVIVASRLGRAGERLQIVDLDRFASGDVDMLTIVIVGASSTRSFVRGDGSRMVYTPRGYSAKHGALQ